MMFLARRDATRVTFWSGRLAFERVGVGVDFCFLVFIPRRHHLHPRCPRRRPRRRLRQRE